MRKVPRFLSKLPTHKENTISCFIDDIIRANFVQYLPPVMWWRVVIASRFHGMPIFYLDDEKGGNIVENIRKKSEKAQDRCLKPIYV